MTPRPRRDRPDGRGVLAQRVAAAWLQILLLAAASGAKTVYDECPAGMVLRERNCYYFAGDLTRTEFSCQSLLGKFGDMDCSRSAGSMCDAWAVRACEEIRPKCFEVKRALRRGQRLPPACRLGIFVILDPGENPTPVLTKDEKSDPARDGVPSFQDELARLYSDEVQRVSGPRLPVPDASVSLPQSYKDCLARPDPGLSSWVNGAADHGSLAGSSYLIRRLNPDYFEIVTKINFSYSGAPENRDEVLRRVFGGVKCIERFFIRHRIVLNLMLSDGPADWSSLLTSGQFSVTLWDHYGRSNSSNWDVMAYDDKELCFLMIHEISHRLGLPDRYQETVDWPRKWFTNPDVVPDYGGLIMKSAPTDPTRHTFDPLDLLALTEPLCKYSQQKPAVQPVPQPLPTPTPQQALEPPAWD